MILVITPNPAIDITYALSSLTTGEVHRVYDAEQRAGGKGLNVARVLAQFGERVTVSGFLGGSTGAELRSLLTDTELCQDWVEVAGGTRRTVTVVAGGHATAFNESGHPVEQDAWQQLAALVARHADSGGVVVVSGSHPPGTEPAHLEALLEGARRAGARTIVDTSGPLLLTAAAAGADVLKPNAEELAAATGVTDPIEGAAQLLEAGAGAIVVSLGAAGMVLVGTGTGTGAGAALSVRRAQPTAPLAGNPTGAGDAAVAALARAVAHAAPDAELALILSRALPDAVALSSAAVLSPVAGEVDLPAYERMRAQITVEDPDADC